MLALGAVCCLGQFNPEKHELLGWEKQGDAHASRPVKFSVYLKQRNLSHLEV